MIYIDPVRSHKSYIIWFWIRFLAKKVHWVMIHVPFFLGCARMQIVKMTSSQLVPPNCAAQDIGVHSIFDCACDREWRCTRTGFWHLSWARTSIRYNISQTSCMDVSCSQCQKLRHAQVLFFCTGAVFLYCFSVSCETFSDSCNAHNSRHQPTTAAKNSRMLRQIQSTVGIPTTE